MSREEMIDAPIEYELEVNYSDKSFIREILCCGIRGYGNMSDQELKDEYQEVIINNGGQ